MHNCPHGAPHRLPLESLSVSLLDVENSHTVRECHYPLQSRTRRSPVPYARSAERRRPSVHRLRCERSWSNPVSRNRERPATPTRTARQQFPATFFVSCPPLDNF